MNPEKIDPQIKIKNMLNCFDQLTILDRLDWNKILIRLVQIQTSLFGQVWSWYWKLYWQSSFACCFQRRYYFMSFFANRRYLNHISPFKRFWLLNFGLVCPTVSIQSPITITINRQWWTTVMDPESRAEGSRMNRI